MKDRAGRRRDTTPTPTARPSAVGQPPPLLTVTQRAPEAVGPAQPVQVVQARPIIRKPAPKIRIGPRVVDGWSRLRSRHSTNLLHSDGGPIHSNCRQAPRASRRPAYIPDRIGGFGFQCCVGAFCTPHLRHAAPTGRASRTIASGTRGRGRPDRAGVRWSGRHPLAACSGAVGHRLPPRAAAIRDRESTRHAYALPNCVRSASCSSSLPVPLVGPRGKEEG